MGERRHSLERSEGTGNEWSKRHQTAPDIRVQRRLGFGPGSARFLPRPGRTAFPASASGAPVRRCADAGAPTDHSPRAVCLAAALGALRSGRTSAARERGRTLPAGPGSPRSLFGGAAPVDRCRARGEPAHASSGAAIPATQCGSRECHDAVQCRHRVGISAAQLGARRGAADRLRVCGWYPDRLAPVPGTRLGHVVRDTIRRRLEGLACWDVVWLREPADLPVPAGPLVFSTLHLEPFYLAGIT